MNYKGMHIDSLRRMHNEIADELADRNAKEFAETRVASIKDMILLLEQVQVAIVKRPAHAKKLNLAPVVDLKSSLTEFFEEISRCS